MSEKEEEAIIECYLAKYGKDSLLVIPEKIAEIFKISVDCVHMGISNMIHLTGSKKGLSNASKLFRRVAIDYENTSQDSHKKIAMDIIKRKVGR